MPSLAACRCHFRLMRRCFLGRWMCLLLSERFRLVWRCHLCDYSTYIPFYVHWHEGQCLWRLVPIYAVVFRLGWVYLPISLCHGTLIFMGYLNSWLSIKKNSSSTIYTITGRIRGFIPFPKGIFSESERNSATGVRTHYSSAVQCVNYYTMRTPPCFWCIIIQTTKIMIFVLLVGLVWFLYLMAYQPL